MSKINKRILLILAILCIFIIIPCSFASDLNDNSTLTDNPVADDNSIYISIDSGNDDTGKGTQASPYQSISKAVENFNSSTNSNIFIKNGTYVFDGGVNINKQVTIVGESNTGVILDGNKTSTIFNVDANNVVISGLTFVNAYCDNSYGRGGSAIFSDSDNLIVNNCIFESNEGGAVTATGSNVLINDSMFINNVAEGWAASGSAFSIMSGSSNVTNCMFINNTAEYGGTVFASNGHRKEYFENCTFIGNNATNKDGGGSAIYMYNMYDDVTIINCVFKDNVALNNQPVIDIDVSHFYVDPVLYLKDNVFENNVPSKEISTNMKVVYLDKNDFIKAININKDYEMKVGDDENFTVTLTDISGKGIPDKLITITFTDYLGRVNSYTATTNEEGKAIISLVNQTAGTFNVVSSFAGDSNWDAVNTTSLVYIKAAHSYNVVFNESIVKVKAGTSHIVKAYICNEYIIPLGDGAFSEYEIEWDSRTTHGYYSTSVFDVDVYDFDLSTRNEYYYINFTVHSQNDYYVTATGTLIIDTSIPFPPVDKDIDVIYVSNYGSDELGDGSEENPLATVQTALFVNQEFGGNKVIYVKEGTYEVSNLEIYANVTVIGDKSKTIFKQTVGNEGMLYLDNGATTNFINITFVDGYMEEYSLYGAVIVVRYKGSIANFDGCEFYNNRGSSDGVIFVAHNSVAYFDNCRFENNSAWTFSPAGAIQVRDAYLSVNNSYFANNLAVEGAGIFVAGDSYAIIENTVFYNNTAWDDNISRSGGGAIYINNWNTHISNCSFIENYAENYGGAIYILIGYVEIEKCLFANNRVKSGEGSAIGSDSGLEIHLFVDHSELFSNDYHRQVYIVNTEDVENEIIINNNYWGNTQQPGANDNVIIKPSINSTEIDEGEVYEITLEFVSENGETLDKPMHDLRLDLIPEIGNVDSDSINIVNNTAKFIYYATNAGYETIVMSYNNALYRYKFTVEDPTSFKTDLDAKISINDNNTQIIVEVPINIQNNVTIKVDNESFSVKPDGGIATLDVSYLLPGQHKAIVIYAGDTYYKADISDMLRFTVDKYNPNLKIFVNNYTAGENVVVNVTAYNSVSGIVLVTINNKNYTVTLSEGKGSTVITTLTTGHYTAKAIFEGNDLFAEDTAITSFDIDESDVKFIYVSPQGSDDNDGSELAPYASISKALDKNRRLGGNRTIFVSEGNYILNRYSISNDVTVIGEGNVIISQNADTSHIYIGGNVNVVLDGLTFINGVGTQCGSIETGSDDAGNIGKTLTIANCNFINNTGPVGVIISYASTTITKSSFINNTATGKNGHIQAIISIQDNTLNLANNIFLNNNYENEMIISRVAGNVNDNFWGDNNKPGDVDKKLNLTSWVCIVPSIDDDVRTKTDYDFVVKFQKTTDGVNFADVDEMPDLTVDVEAKNGELNQSSILITKNSGEDNYVVYDKGNEIINVNVYDKIIASLEFDVSVPEYDKIYVSPNGRDSNSGSKDAPLATIKQALVQNKATGGSKTIVLLPGEFNEHDLIIDAIAAILGENATINGEGKTIFTISADAEITNVTFINANVAINQTESTVLLINGSEFTDNTNAVISNGILDIMNSAFTKNNNAIVSNCAVTVDNSEFIQNTGIAVYGENNAAITNSNFTDNENVLKLVNSNANVENNIFENNNVAIDASSSTVAIKGNNFTGESIVLTDSNADLVENTNTTIKLINSNITNAVVSFMEAKTVIAGVGIIVLNATVVDNMGNIIDGGQITFTSNGAKLGTADVKNGVAVLKYRFGKGNYTISGSFDSDKNATIADGLLRTGVDYFWFIGEVGYENLADAIAAAELGDVIKGLPGTYEVGKLQIGHRYFEAEPWEVFKSVTITSMNDTPVVLKGSGVQMFFVDIGSELTLKNLIIRDAGSSSDDGGAIGTLYETNLTIINCTFINNKGGDGGAVYAFGNTKLEIRDTVFDSNVGALAGALQITGYGTQDIILRNLTFTNNVAHYAGALYVGGGTSELIGAKFINNTASVGGAMFTNGADITVIDAEFISNTAVSNDEIALTAMGGAYHNMLSDATFRDVRFIDNHADGIGGALELENGYYGTVTWTIIDNCTFENNTANDGGAIYLGDTYDPYVKITSSVFDSNTAENNGAAISDNFGHVTIETTKFINNKAGSLDIIHVAGDIIEDEPFYSQLALIECELTSNSADYVIFTNTYSEVVVLDSKFDVQNMTLFNWGIATFEDTVVTNSLDYVIENLGTLHLLGNEFDTPILNNETIESVTYIVILGNETVYAPIGENYILKAVIVDDNENVIEGESIKFVVGGSQIDAVYQNNEFEANYTVKDETQTIDAIIEGEGLEQVKVKTATLIGKASSEMSLEVPEVNVGDIAEINVKLNSQATGNVTINVGNKTYTVAVNKGVVKLTVGDLKAGEYPVEVTYEGDSKFAPATDSKTLVVSKISDYKINTEIVKSGIDDDITINVILPNDASGQASVVVDGDAYPVIINNGRTSVVVSKLSVGDHNLTVQYDGDDKYENSTLETTFRVGKLDSYVRIEVDDVEVGSDAKINLIVPRDATGNVIVTFEGKEYLGTIYEGKAIVNIPGLSIGEYDIEALYVGDSTYLDSTNRTSFKVVEKVILKKSLIDLTVDGNAIKGVLSDDDGKPISSAEIKYTANGNYASVLTGRDGSFTIEPQAGVKTIIIFEGNEKYAQVNTSLTIKNPLPTSVKVESRFNIANNAITINGYAIDTDAGEQGIRYSTELLDANGKPISGAFIQFAVNNKIYNRTTLENGSMDRPYQLDMKRAGRYTMAFSFGGNDKYNSTFAVVCVDLDKKPIKIKASAKTFKASTKTKKYTVTLKTIVGSSYDGKAHLKSGLKVTLTVNGKTYTGKTTSNGKVTFKITNLSKKAKYVAKISYAGDMTYESATKKVKITVK